MAYFMPIFKARKVVTTLKSVQSNIGRVQYGQAGMLASVSGGKGKGTETYLEPATYATYEEEADRIITACKRALQTFVGESPYTSWSELDKDTQTRCTVQYTARDGKSTVDAEYVTRLRMSLYSCMDKFAGDETLATKDLETFRLVRSLDRTFRLYVQAVQTLKINDGIAKAQRKLVETIDEVNAHDASLFPSQTDEETGEELAEVA